MPGLLDCMNHQPVESIRPAPDGRVLAVAADPDFISETHRTATKDRSRTSAGRLRSGPMHHVEPRNHDESTPTKALFDSFVVCSKELRRFSQNAQSIQRLIQSSLLFSLLPRTCEVLRILRYS
jgi:hypothetical protein